MRNFQHFTFIVLLISLTCFALADEVTLNDGTVYSGTIFSADPASIIMQTNDSTSVAIPKSRVKTIFFHKSDLVYLLDGSVIECKILEQVFPNLKIVTESGNQHVRVIDLKRYFHNEADSLFVPSLPPTGALFLNKENYVFTTKHTGLEYMVSAYGGLSVPPSGSWQNYFITAANVLSLNGGLQAGYMVSKDIMISAGAEFAGYNNSVGEDLTSHFNTMYLYLSGSLQNLYNFSDNLRTFANVDIGLFSMTGNFYMYSYRKIKILQSENSYGFRIGGGLVYDIDSNISMQIKSGYMVSNLVEYEPPAAGLGTIKIDFNGFYVLTGINYYFNL